MKRAVSLCHLSPQNKCLALFSSCYPKLQTVIITKASSIVGGFEALFLWWRVVECGGVWWSEEECGGVWWSETECGGVRRRSEEE